MTGMFLLLAVLIENISIEHVKLYTEGIMNLNAISLDRSFIHRNWSL